MGSVSKIGLPPGSLVYTGKQQKNAVIIEGFEYSDATVNRVDAIKRASAGNKLWLDLNGVHDTGLITATGETFELHPLTLEDITNPDQRPKLEVFDEYIFIELNLIDYDKKTETLFKEQIAIVLGRDFVLTFQEFSHDVFRKIKKAIADPAGSLHKAGSDYLAYTLIDSIVDHYFMILHEIREDAELIEEKLFGDYSKKVIQEIYGLKKSILTLRKYIRPLEEAMHEFSTMKSVFISDQTQLFARDIIDHLKRISDQVEHLSGLASEMIELYQSQAGNRMNEIMKTLTLVGAVFIPLTFFTGLYGMNFKYMPELNWRYSYPVLLVSFAVTTVSLLIYFRVKKWF